MTEARPGGEQVGDDEQVYPCADCGVMRSKSEGGTTFTVCDECWDKHFPPAKDPTSAGGGQ